MCIYEHYHNNKFNHFGLPAKIINIKKICWSPHMQYSLLVTVMITKKNEYKIILSKKRISMALQAVHCLVLAWCVSCAVVVCKIINNNKCLPYWLRSYFFKKVPINIKNFVNYLYNVSTSGSAEGMAHFWLGDFSIVVFTDFFYVQFIFLVFFMFL